MPSPDPRQLSLRGAARGSSSSLPHAERTESRTRVAPSVPAALARQPGLAARPDTGRRPTLEPPDRNPAALRGRRSARGPAGRRNGRGPAAAAGERRDVSGWLLRFLLADSPRPRFVRSPLRPAPARPGRAGPPGRGREAAEGREAAGAARGFCLPPAEPPPPPARRSGQTKRGRGEGRGEGRCRRRRGAGSGARLGPGWTREGPREGRAALGREAALPPPFFSSSFSSSSSSSSPRRPLCARQTASGRPPPGSAARQGDASGHTRQKERDGHRSPHGRGRQPRSPRAASYYSSSVRAGSGKLRFLLAAALRPTQPPPPAPPPPPLLAELLKTRGNFRQRPSAGCRSPRQPPDPRAASHRPQARPRPPAARSLSSPRRAGRGKSLSSRRAAPPERPLP